MELNEHIISLDSQVMSSNSSGKSLIEVFADTNTENPAQQAEDDDLHENLMQYFIYILECADKSLYVGCTNNLERRIKQHNDSKWGAHYTKIRRPVELKYKEVFKTLKEARQRETEIKGWRREKKFTLINS